MNIDITDPGTLAILFGCLTIIGVIDFSIVKWRFIKNGNITIGTVIEHFVTKEFDPKSGIRIRFITDENAEITFTEQPWRKNKYPISSEIEIIYNNEHPETAHINTNTFLWFGEFCFLVMGLGMLLVGIFGNDYDLSLPY